MSRVEGGADRKRLEEGVSGHGSSVSETVGAWLVFMRCAGCGFKSLKLLETAWTVFCREKPADVSELRIGGRGSSLHNIRGRIL